MHPELFEEEKYWIWFCTYQIWDIFFPSHCSLYSLCLFLFHSHIDSPLAIIIFHYKGTLLNFSLPCKPALYDQSPNPLPIPPRHWPQFQLRALDCWFSWSHGTCKHSNIFLASIFLWKIFLWKSHPHLTKQSNKLVSLLSKF